MLQATASRAETLSCAVRADPFRVHLDVLNGRFVEVFETKTAIVLLALNLDLLLERSPSLFVLDKLLKCQTVHHFAVEAFSHIDLDAIDLRRVRINHFMAAARKVTLREYYFSLELLAVMAELEHPSLVPVLDLKQLKLV